MSCSNVDTSTTAPQTPASVPPASRTAPSGALPTSRLASRATAASPGVPASSVRGTQKPLTQRLPGSAQSDELLHASEPGPSSPPHASAKANAAHTKLLKYFIWGSLSVQPALSSGDNPDTRTKPKIQALGTNRSRACIQNPNREFNLLSGGTRRRHSRPSCRSGCRRRPWRCCLPWERRRPGCARHPKAPRSGRTGRRRPCCSP